MCISTDKGVTFYSVPLPGLPSPNDVSAPGPIAVSCLDSDRCFAFNGVDSEANTFYVYYTTNASMAKASTWTRATVPAALAGSDEVDPHQMFFAPDGVHGWLVGTASSVAMVLRTTDSGHTWTDVSGPVRAVTTFKLAGGFALDADHVWVGGEHKTLIYNGHASQ